MDIESRAIKRVKQEQQALRKVAAGIAKEVRCLSGGTATAYRRTVAHRRLNIHSRYMSQT